MNNSGGSSSSVGGFFDVVQNVFHGIRALANPGLVVIFKQENFHDDSLRSYDGVTEVLALQTLFSKLRYTIEIHNDKTFDEIEHEINKLRYMDLTKHRCLVVVVLTHGTVCGTLKAYDTDYSFQTTIVDKIKQNNTLDGIPKIFIVSAALGRTKPKVNHRNNTNNNYQTVTLPVIHEANVLKIYNVYKYGNRNQHNSNTFMRTFCNIIDENEFMDINDVLMKCRRIMLQRFTDYLPIETTTMMGKFSFQYGLEEDD